MSKIYETEVFNGEVFDHTAHAIVQAITLAFSRNRKVVRILEVGAGTGRMTSLVGQALSSCAIPADCVVDYVCTDVSIALAQDAAKKSPWSTITAQAYDITRPATEQHLQERSFDIILAFDVLHAIPDLHAALSSILDLLVPSGFLAAIELDGEAFALSLPGSICKPRMLQIRCSELTATP